MKHCFLIFLLALLLGSCGRTDQSGSEALPPITTTGRDTIHVSGEESDSIAVPRIVFLQRINGQLVSQPYWSGPLIAAEFYDKNGSLLQRVNLRERNPYLDIGLKVEPYAGDEHNNTIELRNDKAVPKSQIKAYLPSYLYHEIPDEWRFQRAITICRLGRNWARAQGHLAVYYLMEWEPRDERDLMGNCGVTTVTVLDSTGTEVYRRQFDGILSDALVSFDGKYLGITYTLYPESTNDSIPRLNNYAELIYLPEDKSVWKNSTSLLNEGIFFTNYHGYIAIKKRKEREDVYHLWVLSTATDELYYRHMTETSWKGGITGIEKGLILRQLPNEAGVNMSLYDHFHVKNILNQ